MANELDAFNNLSVDKRIPEADELTAYYEWHAKLCNKYKTEIEYIRKSLEELRTERKDFFEKEIPKIRKSLKEQLIDENVIDDWTEKLKSDMDRSFEISEELIKNFYVGKFDEFEHELKERLNKV